MYQNFERGACDPHAPYRPAFYGTFELPVPIGGKQRRMLVYVPADVRESTAGVLVLGANGRTADDLLCESGWREIADQEESKEKLIVFFLEPEQGMWHTEEPYGIADGDIAYVDAAAAVAAQRFLFCVHEAKLYLTGCREGGVIANMAAAWNPAIYAGIATIGGSAVLPDYLAAARADFCTNLDGYVDEAHSHGIRKGDIPMPAWIIDDPKAEARKDTALEHWKMVTRVEPVPRKINPDQDEYYRTAELPYAANQDKNACRVCHSVIPGASANDAHLLLRRIWKDFLYRQRRWMSGPGGDLRVTRDPVRDLGMEYHYEEIDGWMREWYVYMPESVRRHPEKRVPLVLAMHGYTCNGEIYAGNSGWYQVADQYGLIIVHPTALYAKIDMENNCIDPNNAPLPAWNVFEEDDRPDELHFFTTLLDRMCADYPVDPARVFATGHSWGSLMTQMLGLAMPERFAAIAPCSGVFFGGAEKKMLAQDCMKNRSDVEMPVWMFCGEREEFLIDAVPKNDNVTGFNIAMWLRNNHMIDQIPPDWADCTPITNGRWHDRFFDKDGVPMVRFTSVDYMPHATMPEMSLRIWEEFFSHFCREGEQIQYHKLASEVYARKT